MLHLGRLALRSFNHWTNFKDHRSPLSTEIQVSLMVLFAKEGNSRPDPVEMGAITCRRLYYNDHLSSSTIRATKLIYHNFQVIQLRAYGS